MLYKLGLYTADAIVVQNENDQINLRKYFNYEGRVIRSMTEIKKGNIGGKRDSILWVGRAAPVKDPLAYLLLAESLPDIKFVMIMTRSSNEKGLFEMVKNKAKKVKNLKLIDFVPRQELASFYEKARALINTSVSEGFPNTFMEAGLAGTPIGSLNVNPDGIITRHDLGKWSYGNLDILAIWIEQIIRSKKLWYKYSKNCSNYIENYHDLSKNGKLWIRLFDELIRGKYRHPGETPYG